MKEARLLEVGDREGREETRRAQKLFLRDHLGRFGPALARSLTKEATHPFYRAVGDFCFELVTSDCRFLDVASGPEFLELRPTSDPGVPMACSTCSLLEHGAPLHDGPGRR